MLDATLLLFSLCTYNLYLKQVERATKIYKSFLIISYFFYTEIILKIDIGRDYGMGYDAYVLKYNLLRLCVYFQKARSMLTICYVLMMKYINKFNLIL